MRISNRRKRVGKEKNFFLNTWGLLPCTFEALLVSESLPRDYLQYCSDPFVKARVLLSSASEAK